MPDFTLWPRKLEDFPFLWWVIKSSEIREYIFNKFPLCEKCPYSEFFWSVFSLIRTEYGEIRSIFPYSVRMRENTDQKNSKYGHFSRIVHYSHSECKNFLVNYISYNILPVFLNFSQMIKWFFIIVLQQLHNKYKIKRKVKIPQVFVELSASAEPLKDSKGIWCKL